MPFGPTNAPIFYSATIKDFKTEWDTLFTIRVLALKILNNKSISFEGSDIILIGVQSSKILKYCNIGRKEIGEF